MVLDTAVYHPTLTKLVKFLDKTAGRDKAFRLAQYLVRFLAFYSKQCGVPAEVVQLFKTLQANFTFIRKGLRFLKPLNHLQDAVKAFDNRLSDPVLRATATIKQLAYLVYLTFDGITFFKLLGLISAKRLTKLPKYANYFWFLGLIAGLVNDLRKIAIASSKLQSSDEKDDDKRAKVLALEKYAATKRLAWDCLDFYIVLNNLNYLNGSEGSIGLAGTITSLMGFQDVWDGIKI